MPLTFQNKTRADKKKDLLRSYLDELVYTGSTKYLQDVSKRVAYEGGEEQEEKEQEEEELKENDQ